MRGRVLILMVALAWGSASALRAEDAAPSEGKTLCEIVEAVEAAGYSQVSEVVFEDAAWQVEAYKDGERRRLRVDPDSAEIESEGADDDDD